MATINPYLNFNGNTEEVFDFYKSVFGGEFITVMRYKDVPCDIPTPEHNPDRIMHIALPIGGGSILMGSDRPEVFGPGTRGDNFYIAIGATNEEEATKLFNSLAEGGQITMPLEKAFWGALFGMLVDKFGIQWMVSYDSNTL